MKVLLSASESVLKKLQPLIEGKKIAMVSKPPADYALVEAGRSYVQGMVNITFEALDYQEACDLLLSKLYQDDSGTYTDTDAITGMINDRFSLIPIGEILSIEASGSEIICLTQQDSYRLKKPLYYYEETLSPKGLIRINKSQLVNLSLVKEIIPWFNGRLVLKISDDYQVEVSKTYAKRLRAMLDL